MSHFDSLSGQLTGEALQSLRRHLDHVPLTHAELVARVEAHRERVRVAAQDDAMVNLDLSERIADMLVVLLGRVPDDGPSRLHALIQGAVLYYAEHEDAQDDLTSAFGFDDDLEVVLAIQSSIDAA